MDNTDLRAILGTFFEGSDQTCYEELSESHRRQFVVTALLELYKAEALGAGDKSHALNSNLGNLNNHVAIVMRALIPE